MRGDHFYRFGLQGSADIFALKKGKLYALEVKSSTGKLSNDQIGFLENINKNGGIGIVVRSIEDVQKVDL